MDFGSTCKLLLVPVLNLFSETPNRGARASSVWARCGGALPLIGGVVIPPGLDYAPVACDLGAKRAWCCSLAGTPAESALSAGFRDHGEQNGG